MAEVSNLYGIRDIPLRKYAIEGEDLKKRLGQNTDLLKVWFLVFSFVPFVRYGMDILTHDKANLGKAFAMFLTYAILGSIWYLLRRLRFNQELEDKIVVEDDQIVLVRDISSDKIRFRKIKNVSTCTEGLWVEHGWTYTILENKYFERYTDMLKFKDALLEVARASRRK